MEQAQADWQLRMAEDTFQWPELYPHQAEAIEKLDDGKVLCAGVGTGKTRTALHYYMTRHAPKDILVITTARKRDELDWQREAAGFGIGTTHDSTVAGVLTVDSWNNIGRYADVQGMFLVLDEQRLVGSGKWVKTFLKMAKHNRWIMLSATPGDSWIDYAPLFIANGFYRNITEFKREHCVFSYYGSFPKLERYLVEGKLIKLRDQLLVDMPYTRHTVRHIHQVYVDYDETLMEQSIKRRWSPFTNKPMKDAAELYSVMRRIANSSLSRLNAVHQLLERHPKLIVFYTRDYELETLRTLVSTTTIAEWNGHRHDPIPQTDSFVYLVQYQAGAEAWNCTETDAMVFYSLQYSYRNFEQAQGRIDRLDTPFVDLHYYVLRSRSFIDSAIWRALSGKRDFNEREQRTPSHI